MPSFCAQCGKPLPEHDPSCLAHRLAQQPLPPLAEKTPFTHPREKQAHDAPHVAGPTPPLDTTGNRHFGPLNRFIWALAFAPIIGVLLEYTIAHIFYSSSIKADTAFHNGYFVWVTLILNIGLCTQDEKHLKKHGIDTQPIGAAWLVPVYIFKRSKRLQDGPLYFYLWIGSLIAAMIFNA